MKNKSVYYEMIDSYKFNPTGSTGLLINKQTSMLMLISDLPYLKSDK